jgi:hypothetical protein
MRVLVVRALHHASGSWGGLKSKVTWVTPRLGNRMGELLARAFGYTSGYIDAMVSLDDQELGVLLQAAQQLPAECRQAWLVDVSTALSLVGPRGSARMIERLTVVHLARCMGQMSPTINPLPVT